MNSEHPPPALKRLRNPNPSGNPRAALRCSARNRAGEPCLAPAMVNGRCRCHGGKSTGPRTRDGLKRLRAARTVHGFYGEEGRAFRHTVAALFAQGRWLRLLAELRNAPLPQGAGTRADQPDDTPGGPDRIRSRIRDGVRRGI
jgi:hypothetical protein